MLDFKELTKEELIEYINNLYIIMSEYVFIELKKNFMKEYLSTIITRLGRLYNIDVTQFVNILENNIHDIIYEYELTEEINHLIANNFFEADIIELYFCFITEKHIFDKKNINKYKNNVIKFINGLKEIVEEVV